MNETQLIPEERVQKTILLLRGQKVIIDTDLAILYDISTKRLNEAIKRNISRFPSDFMFQLTKEEAKNLRSQFATSSFAARRYLPYAFTEHGALMAATVLNSPRAVAMSLAIIRTFVKLRQILMENKDLAKRLDILEEKYDKRFKVVFDALRELLDPPVKSSKHPIGFNTK